MTGIREYLSRWFRSAGSAAAPPEAPARLEPLEERLLLSLLGVVPELPAIVYNSTGTIAYDSASEQLKVEASPLYFRQSGTSPLRVVADGSVLMQVRVDSDGQLVGGVAGDDLLVTGEIDLDGDGTVDASGTLLTGEVLAYGWQDTSETIDNHDFRFQLTGGALAGLYAGKDIGVDLSSENSSFAGDFTVDFDGGAKGNIGALDMAPGIDIEKYVKGDDQPPCECLCALYGKPRVLTMVYTGDGADATSHSQDAGKVSVVGDPQDEPLVRIVVADKADPGDSKAAVYFDGQVALGASFVIDAAAAGREDLKANTYVFVLDPASGDVLQTVMFHTSCSQPLELGDQFGSVELVSFVGETGGASLPDDTVPDDYGDDADEPTGPILEVGSTVRFTYVVTNTGGTALADVVVTDDNYTPACPCDDYLPDPIEEDGYNVGDADQDGLLDVGESWLYTATETVTKCQHVNVGTVVATPVDESGNVIGDDVTDSDPAHYKGVCEPQGDFQGLTPGFWKQPHHFKFWTDYQTDDKYADVFGVDLGCDLTLLDALRAKGGGMNALLRHSVAALLNAANTNVNYRYSVEEVKATVQQAFLTGEFESAKDVLEAQNELEGVNLKGGKDKSPKGGKDKSPKGGKKASHKDDKKANHKGDKHTNHKCGTKK